MEFMAYRIAFTFKVEPKRVEVVVLGETHPMDYRLGLAPGEEKAIEAGWNHPEILPRWNGGSEEVQNVEVLGPEGTVRIREVVRR